MSIWGRLLGGAAGFALGGPIGAILGVMAGSAFDIKNKKHLIILKYRKIKNNKFLQLVLLFYQLNLQKVMVK